MGDYIDSTNGIIEELLKVVPDTFIMSDVFNQDCRESEFHGRWYIHKAKVALRGGNMYQGTGNLIRFKPSYDYRTWTSPTTAITG